MSYQSFETTAGDALLEVQTLCRHAARASGAFSTTTVPTLAAVEQWLTTSNYWIQGILLSHGYTAAQTGASALSILQQLNVYDTCMKVELSLPAADGSGEPNGRFREFSERRQELLDMVIDGTLSVFLGLTGAGLRRLPIVTGLSRSRKRLVETDTDATQHRVRRGQFNAPGNSEQASLVDSNEWSPA